MLTADYMISRIFREQRERRTASGLLPADADPSACGQDWLLTLLHHPEQVNRPPGEVLVHTFPVASLDEGMRLLHQLTEALADYPIISNVQAGPVRPEEDLFLVICTRIIPGFRPGSGKPTG